MGDSARVPCIHFFLALHGKIRRIVRTNIGKWEIHNRRGPDDIFAQSSLLITMIHASTQLSSSAASIPRDLHSLAAPAFIAAGGRTCVFNGSSSCRFPASPRLQVKIIQSVKEARIFYSLQAKCIWWKLFSTSTVSYVFCAEYRVIHMQKKCACFFFHFLALP